MIDLTPLEVRKKKGDFRRAMRGYDPALVDDFLDLVADRLEELVRDNMSLLERVGRQEEQVRDYRDRERALTEALVSAQEMREEVRKQATQEAELARRTAEQQAEQMRATAEAEVRQLRSSAQQKASEALASLTQERQREEQMLREVRARREELIDNYRAFLERELDELAVIARAAGGAGGKAARPAERPTSSGRAARVSDALPPAAAAGPEPEARPAGTRLGASDRPHTVPDADRPDAEAPEEDAPDARTPPVEKTAPAASASARAEIQTPAAEPDVLDESDVAEESALALGASPSDVADEDEEPFAPEPFVDDESEVVADAYAAESVLPVEGADAGTTDQTEVSGGGREERLYDGIAADADGDGVPGPIGLGEPEPWSDAPTWSISDLQLVGGDTDGDALDLDDDLDLDDEDDEEMRTLLRNAAAAGYHLEDEPVTDELLLDEAVVDDSDDAEPDEPADDGWLPTLLEDDK
ncbi:MAG TPA: DivIVA domain-containing protein [Longimicrobiales bacterium]|nr:DivIVA domain-containing protein [Longimicrobiales bacterium]